MIASDYPDEPGHRGVGTSIEAAHAIAPLTARLQRLALAAIWNAGDRGLTAEELAARLNVTRAAAQPRTSELRLRGAIIDSGKRRINASGRRAIVWTAARRRKTA